MQKYPTFLPNFCEINPKAGADAAAATSIAVWYHINVILSMTKASSKGSPREVSIPSVKNGKLTETSLKTSNTSRTPYLENF